MNWILELDKKLFLLLNGWHTNFLDPIMVQMSGKWIWLPLYAILVYLLIRSYKKKVLWILIAIAIGITLSDQITSGFMKPFFERIRPSRDPELDGLVHTVNGYRGGLYGFASSHASNTFFIAGLLFYALKENFNWIKWIFLWAAIVSYSRIYLGVHYPLDILTGALIGISISLLLRKALRQLKVFKSTQ